MSELNKESTAQAEAKRPEVVGYCNPGHIERLKQMEITGFIVHEEGSASISEPLITLAQHERIVGELQLALRNTEALLAQANYHKEQRGLQIKELREERDVALALREEVAALHAQHQRLGVWLSEAYGWGYINGQNNPNGYIDEEDRYSCINDILGRLHEK